MIYRRNGQSFLTFVKNFCGSKALYKTVKLDCEFKWSYYK